MSNKRYIGICGDAGSGKDTVADILVSVSDNIIKYSFAEPVYALAASILGTTPEYLGERKSKEIVQSFDVTQRSLEQANDIYIHYGLDKYVDFPHVWHQFVDIISKYDMPYNVPGQPRDLIFKLHISPRKALELVGTELGRNLIREDVWLKRIEDDIRNLPHTIAVISDVRFDNEADFVKDSGYLIKVKSPNNPYSIKSDHISAKGISDDVCDAILDNSMNGLDSLRKDVLNILETLKGK